MTAKSPTVGDDVRLSQQHTAMYCHIRDCWLNKNVRFLHFARSPNSVCLCERHMVPIHFWVFHSTCMDVYVHPTSRKWNKFKYLYLHLPARQTLHTLDFQYVFARPTRLPFPLFAEHNTDDDGFLPFGMLSCWAERTLYVTHKYVLQNALETTPTPMERVVLGRTAHF